MCVQESCDSAERSWYFSTVGFLSAERPFRIFSFWSGVWQRKQKSHKPRSLLPARLPAGPAGSSSSPFPVARDGLRPLPPRVALSVGLPLSCALSPSPSTRCCQEAFARVFSRCGTEAVRVVQRHLSPSRGPWVTLYPRRHPCLLSAVAGTEHTTWWVPNSAERETRSGSLFPFLSLAFVTWIRRVFGRSSQRWNVPAAGQRAPSGVCRGHAARSAPGRCPLPAGVRSRLRLGFPERAGLGGRVCPERMRTNPRGAGDAGGDSSSSWTLRGRSLSVQAFSRSCFALSSCFDLLFGAGWVMPLARLCGACEPGLVPGTSRLWMEGSLRAALPALQRVRPAPVPGDRLPRGVAASPTRPGQSQALY